MPRSPEGVASASGPAAETVLTDEMLARFAKRAPQYDRDNVFFVRRLRRASPGRVSSRRRSGRARRRGPVARGRRAGSSGGSATTPRRRRSRSTCTCTGPASPPISGAPATVAALAARGRRGWRGVRRRARRERQRHPGAALDDEGRARGRRVPVHRPQVVRQPVAGLDLSRDARHGHRRSVDTEDRARVHAARHRRLPHRADVGRARHARDAQRRHDPATACSCPIATSAGSCPPARPASTLRARGSSPGRCIGFGNIYYGLARRALDLTIDTVKSKRSIALTRPMAYHAELQHRVAQMGLAFESIGPHLDRIAEDWSNGVDHGAAWPAKIFAAKFHAVEESWRIVDLALEVAGGFGIFRQERPRTAVPRRAPRADPPGELDADP